MIEDGWHRQCPGHCATWGRRRTTLAGLPAVVLSEHIIFTQLETRSVIAGACTDRFTGPSYRGGGSRDKGAQGGGRAAQEWTGGKSSSIWVPKFVGAKKINSESSLFRTRLRTRGRGRSCQPCQTDFVTFGTVVTGQPELKRRGGSCGRRERHGAATPVGRGSLQSIPGPP
jgi:hypothetical protein